MHTNEIWYPNKFDILDSTEPSTLSYEVISVKFGSHPKSHFKLETIRRLKIRLEATKQHERSIQTKLDNLDIIAVEKFSSKHV